MCLLEFSKLFDRNNFNGNSSRLHLSILGYFLQFDPSNSILARPSQTLILSDFRAKIPHFEGILQPGITTGPTKVCNTRRAPASRVAASLGARSAEGCGEGRERSERAAPLRHLRADIVKWSSKILINQDLLQKYH